MVTEDSIPAYNTTTHYIICFGSISVHVYCIQNGEMQIGTKNIRSGDGLLKVLKRWTQEMSLKFQGIKFIIPVRTLEFIREDPDRIFLILIPKFGMHDGRFSKSMSRSIARI